MSSRGEDSAAILAGVLQIEREGVSFFEKAHVLVGDPRVREVFDKLAEAKREQLRSLEENLKALNVHAVAKEEQKGLAYPFADFEKAECYVCGYSTGVTEIPESCPRCGASRFAFEKEISLRRAWEIAEEGSYSALKILGEAEKDSESMVKHVLAEQVNLEQKLLEEARRQLEQAGKI